MGTDNGFGKTNQTNHSLRVRITAGPNSNTTFEKEMLEKDRTNMTVWENNELENVSNAKALQLEAARRRAVPIRFNFVARA